MKFRDIRKDDIAIFRPETDLSKVINFARRLDRDNNTSFKYWLENNLRLDCRLLVRAVGYTPKTKTEFARVTIIGGTTVQFGVQSRYLNISERKSKHPITTIFMDDRFIKKSESPKRAIKITLPGWHTFPSIADIWEDDNVLSGN